MSNDRGVAHVLGVILMAGFAITVAATVAVAGASMFADSQSQIETSQVESSFSSLAADASELEDGESVDFDLGTADGQLEVKEDTGHLKIYHEQGGESTTVYDKNVNSLEYTTEDGDVVGYQAGGVFRQHGSGSSVVSAPDFFYRDNALSFPIQKVEGDIQSSGTLAGELSLEREQRHYPNATEGKTNPLEGGTVYVELESEYCQGWEEYFNQQTRGSISEGCADDKNDDDQYDTVEGEVQVELSVPFEVPGDSLAQAVGGGDVDDYDGVEEVDLSQYPSADTMIDEKVSECEDGDSDLICYDDLDSSPDFHADENDKQVVVDGNFTPNGDVIVSGDHNVTFFVNGDVDFSGAGGNSEVGNSDKPEQTTIYTHSSGEIGSSSGGGTPQDVYAIIYGPESDAHFQAAFELDGAIIAESVNTQSSGMEFKQENIDLDSAGLFEEGAGPEFYYLHVTERTVTASD